MFDNFSECEEVCSYVYGQYKNEFKLPKNFLVKDIANK